MKAVYGFVNTPPFVVKDMIERWRQTLDEDRQVRLKVQFVGHGHKVKPQTKVAVFPGIVPFKQNLGLLKEQATVCLVFDSPLVLGQTTIPLLDATKTHSFRFVFNQVAEPQFIELVRQGLSGPSITAPDLKIDLIPTLLGQVKGSLTQLLINALYNSRTPDLRKQTTQIYVAWLLSDRSLVELRDRLLKIKVDPTLIDRFEAFFGTEAGQNIRIACTEAGKRRAEKKPIPYPMLEKKYGVKPFDIRYLLSHARSLEDSEVNQTTYDMARKRKTMLAEEDLDQKVVDAANQALLDVDLDPYEMENSYVMDEVEDGY